MEIKISKTELLKTLSLISGIVEKKTTMPILTNVLIEAKTKKVVFTATDLEVGITSSIQAEVLKEGLVAVHARGLLTL